MTDNKNKSVAIFIDNENMRSSLDRTYDSCHICDYISENVGNIVLGRSYWAFG